MAVYRLSDEGREIRLKEWKRMGGCGLPIAAEVEAFREAGVPLYRLGDVTLGEIANLSVLADRSLAGFAARNLKRPDLVYTEYE